MRVLWQWHREDGIPAISAPEQRYQGQQLGAVYVYRKRPTGDGWAIVCQIINTDLNARQSYWTVALDGSSLIVGKHTDDTAGQDFRSREIYSVFEDCCELKQRITPNDARGLARP